jgi:hypothetical protein
MRNREHGSGLGRWRWVVESTFAWLNQFRRLRVRYEKRADLHEAFLSLAELRRRMIEKSLNPFRISLGNRRVYTTFAIELKTLR